MNKLRACVISLVNGSRGRAENPNAPETIRPERAEAPSPGHRPGYKSNQQGAL